MKRPHTIIYITPDGKVKREFALNQTLFKIIVYSLASLVLLVIVALVFVGTVYSDAIQKRVYADRVVKMEQEMKKIEKLKQDILYLYDKSEKIKELLGIDIQNSILRSHYDETRRVTIDTMVTKESLTNLESSVPDVNPTEGEISRKFSKEHPAIDIATSAGSPVVSAIDGTVSSVGWDENFGNYVKIRNKDFEVFYGHLEKAYVKNLQSVKKGEIVGLVGNSGKSTAPHLHYEIVADTSLVDPEKFLVKTK
ncbi:MAG: M23 family metallopeptidase [bacterium]|nr:M23 family metallopeptidase [bacterium]